MPSGGGGGVAEERVARSVALEQAYVHDVYEQFSDNPKSRPWPRVQEFLEDLEQGSLVCDVGCGSGKYLNVNASIFNVGGDKSARLTDMAREKDNEVMLLDNLALPFREESLDAVLSIAVVHHLATTERRIRALRELARVLRIGGRIIISVWAMEQSHRKFESQDVLVPWNRPQQLSTPSLELTSTTTTSEDDCLHPYHAYTQSDSDSNKSNKTKGSVKKRGKTRHKGRSIDPGRNSSPSSSSLSSPNETCYSFVRRAIQKLAGGRRGVHRPWFLDGWSSACSSGGNDHHHHHHHHHKNGSKKYRDGSQGCNCCECEDVQNLPIELRRVDEDDVVPQRRQTFPSSQLIADIYTNLKSRSLTDIKTADGGDLIRSKSSVPSIQEALSVEETEEEPRPKGTSTTSSMVSLIAAEKPSSLESTPPGSRRKLVKQKKSICDEDAEEALDVPTDMRRRLICEEEEESRQMRTPSSKATHHRGSVFKQRSLNEELMSTDRLREKERVRRNIQKQASLNEDLIYRRHRTFDSLKDSIFSVSTSRRFQLIKSGFTSKIKSSTTNIEKVAGASLRNGFVRMFQNWKSNELVSPVIPEDEAPSASPTKPGFGGACVGSGAVEERRHSKEDGSDSSKDSSLQSDTSVDSEDSFASVIFVPKNDPASPTLQQQQHSSGPTSPRINNSSVPNSPRVVKQQSSCPTSPRIKQMPLSVYPLTKVGSPKPVTSPSSSSATSRLPSLSDTLPAPALTADTSPEDKQNLQNQSQQNQQRQPNRDQIPAASEDKGRTALAQKYAVPAIPKFKRTTNPTTTKTPAAPEEVKPVTTAAAAVTEESTSRTERLKHIRDLLVQRAGFGGRTLRPHHYPIVRRSSMSNGRYDALARPLPKLLSLELFNPETDDKDSDSSAVSSPDSVESVVENSKLVRASVTKFSFPPTASSSTTLLEAAAKVAHSLDEAVDKVIRSSPRGRRQLRSSDVASVMRRHYDAAGSDAVPLLGDANDTTNASVNDESLWDEDCHRHLTDFADKLSEKLLREIDQYGRASPPGTVGVGAHGEDLLASTQIADPYIDRLSEELCDLSKLSEEIQKQNEYLAMLSASDSCYGGSGGGKVRCTGCKRSFCKCDGTVRTNSVKGQNRQTVSKDAAQSEEQLKGANSGAGAAVSSASTTTTSTRLPSAACCQEASGDANCSSVGDVTSSAQRALGRSAIKKNASVESCESERGSSSNSVISSVATSVHFGLSMESTDGTTSERGGSSDSHRGGDTTTSSSRFSDVGGTGGCGSSTASLVSCRVLADGDSSSGRGGASRDKSGLLLNRHQSLSDTSQESLPSDNMGGAITYHRYYHVFREGELDQLIEKYVQNLHIISSYYDHSSWCVVAEKVQVWTI